MFKPLRKKVLLRRVREEKLTTAGLWIPDASRKNWNEYVVVRVGEECEELVEGDRVLADKVVGLPITEVEQLDEKELAPQEGVRVCEEADILAKVTVEGSVTAKDVSKLAASS